MVSIMSYLSKKKKEIAIKNKHDPKGAARIHHIAATEQLNRMRGPKLSR